MPATNTYTPIASVTLSSSASQVNFTALPSGFRDLVLVVNFKPLGYTQIRFNNVSTSSYASVTLYGNGSSGGTNNYTIAHIDTSNNVGDPDNSNVILTMQLMDFAQTDRHKTFLTRVDNASSYTHLQANRFTTNDAVTSINLIQTGTWAAGSTFNLYGVVA